MIVVDTNIVAYLYLPGEYTAAANLNTQLVTMDGKLLRAFPKFAVSLVAG